jgi:RHS repeat-associated protein
LVPNRHGSSSAYRYGFQGQEKDDEIKGEGNVLHATDWKYDSRIGRRWNRDPIVKWHESPYSAFANNPIMNIDPTGRDTIRFQTLHIRVPQPKNKMDRAPIKVADIHSESISITKAPGEDVFLFENTIIDMRNGGKKTSSTTTQIDYNGAGLTVTKGLFGFLSQRDDGQTTLAKWAPKELINYLVKKDFRKYKSLDIRQQDVNFYEGFKSVSEFAISWYVSGILMNSVGKLGSLNVNSISIENMGISKIETHLARMDSDAANSVMLSRLKKITNGEIEATIIDKNFYYHELREMELMAKGMTYESAHVKALQEAGIKYSKGFEKNLYTSDALKAGDDAFLNGK